MPFTKADMKHLDLVSSCELFVSKLSPEHKSALMVALMADYGMAAQESKEPEKYRQQLINLFDSWCGQVFNEGT